MKVVEESSVKGAHTFFEQLLRLIKGEHHAKNEFHIYLRIWAGEWRCENLSRQCSFVSEKIDQEETITTHPDDEMVTQVV